MATISYTLSSQLRESLKKIDILQHDILLAVLPPRIELCLRWQALIERIFWALSLSDIPLGKNEIAKLLAQAPKKRLTPPQQEVVRLRKAFNYITQEWQALQKPVPLKTVITLHNLSTPGSHQVNLELLQQCLAYFENSSEHPVIQAALIHSQIFIRSPFKEYNGRISRLLSYLFLYKEGYDCRGLLVLEEYFRRNFTDYQQILKQRTATGAQTVWLEYYAKGIAIQLEKALEDIAKEKTRMEVPVLAIKLNERQKEILVFLENPEATITNRQIQKLFKISQITASRDLAKLVLLGLLFTHGRGRSVYYTKT